MFEICKERKPQGTRELSKKRRYFLDLVYQGMSITEAARIVGVDVRTGREWRNGRPKGRKKRPRKPARHEFGSGPASCSGRSRYLSKNERSHIADRFGEGAGVRTIARELGRAPSTVSRESRRNGIPAQAGSRKWAYRPYAAHRRALARRPRPKAAKIASNLRLRQLLQHHLDRKLSPQQSTV